MRSKTVLIANIYIKRGVSMDKKPRCYLSGAITGVKHADKLFTRAE